MNELIKIVERGGKKAVSARELYEFLGLDSSQWSRWYQKNILNNKFAIENEDFFELDIMSRSKDFALSIEFSKKLSMMARTEQGEKARQYFIECEKELVNNKMALSEAQIILQTLQHVQVQSKAIESHEERIKAIEQKQFIEIEQDYFTILAFCKRNKVHLTFSEAIQKGKIATRLSKEKGFDLRQVSDEKYGYVNSYKYEILKEAFQL
jgi:phage anti-repressor protein